MRKGLKAVGEQSSNMGWVYGLYTKTRIKVAIARNTKEGWVWTLSAGETNYHKAESLQACIYAVEEEFGLPHAEPKSESSVKRVKVADQSYEIRDRESGVLVGTAVKTGTSRDNYPWNWSMEDSDGVGVADSLKGCIEAIVTYWD